MEFTRPMDRDLVSVRKADEQKEVKSSCLRQALERTLSPGLEGPDSHVLGRGTWNYCKRQLEELVS